MDKMEDVDLASNTDRAQVETDDAITGDDEDLSESAQPENTSDSENDDADDEASGPPTKRTKYREKNSTGTKNTGDPLAMRKFGTIPIFVVDYHNDVLEFLYRCWGSRHIPLENNILLHFDSHPDMVVPKEILASACYDKDAMLSYLSIENWIIPTCYAGHFNRVIWIKNSWCSQIPVGKYSFKIGKTQDNKLSVDCPLDYFLSEGNYTPTEQLAAARDIELQVYNADDGDNLKPEDILSPSDAKNYILDIDLDFFTTSNPFLNIYRDVNCYEKLIEIFKYVSTPDDYNGTAERRRQQLEALRAIFDHLEEQRTYEGYKPPENIPAHIISEETVDKIKALESTLKEYYPDQEIDWLLIYDSGSTSDNNGLPHHASTDSEIDDYFRAFESILKRLPVQPIAVIISRSSEDDYCPKDQVEDIQGRVFTMLQTVYGESITKKPLLYYSNEEWDFGLL